MALRSELRSAKFAEYLSTYAILNSIGLHPTTLLERRDSSVGIGVYVRDACDAGTSLLVVPSKRFVSNSVLTKIGTKIRLRGDEEWKGGRRELDDGLITYLTQSDQTGRGALEWMEWGWRVGIEMHRGYSNWWGWLQSIPTAKEYQQLEERCASVCRVQHPTIAPYYQRSRKKIESEIEGAYRLLQARNMMPCYAYYRRAVWVLLSRGILVPIGWRSKEEEEKNERHPLEIAVVPFIDCINGVDFTSPSLHANCDVEPAFAVGELPSWYVAWIQYELEQQSKHDVLPLRDAFVENYYLCATLNKPLRSSEEVILNYWEPKVETGVLDAASERVLSRLVKYFY